MLPPAFCFCCLSASQDGSWRAPVPAGLRLPPAPRAAARRAAALTPARDVPARSQWWAGGGPPAVRVRGGQARTWGRGGPGGTGAMGRKLDPSKKEKRGPGRKARKQRGAEVELARFLSPGKCGPSRRGALAVPRSAPPECRFYFRRGGERPEEAVQPRAEEVRAARLGAGFPTGAGLRSHGRFLSLQGR